MDLISREAEIEACIEISKQEEEHSRMWAAGLRYAKRILTKLPSVPAVPLDKLCEWLSKFGSTCEINEDMCEQAHGYDRCIGIFNSSAFCWQCWLTKMMEEQDAKEG